MHTKHTGRRLINCPYLWGAVQMAASSWADISGHHMAEYMPIQQEGGKPNGFSQTNI